MRNTTTRAGVALLIAGGVSWAASAAADTVTAAGPRAVTLSAEAYGLHPGGAVDVKVRSDNPNPVPVTITRFDNIEITSSNEGCGPQNITFEATPLTAPTGHDEQTLANAVTMIAGADDACQGNVFTISMTVKA